MALEEQEIRSGTVEELAETVSDAEKREAVHNVRSAGDALFTWDYERSRGALSKLYEKAKTSMWNVSTDIDWDIDVDPWKIARDPNNPLNTTMALERSGTPFEKLTEDEWYDLGAAQQAWVLSQFMHGEQGALICTAKIVEQVPWIDAKYYAATQVMIEGLALAAFGFQYQTSPDPLLKQITRYVMADEARHVAFGVLSLKEAYADLDYADVHERQEFCYDAAVKMRDRFLGQEVWEWAGLPVQECTRVMLDAPMQREFRKMLFSKIVPNLKKLGLLDAGDGWLRQKFGELGVLEYEDWEDTGAEYERMQLEQTAAS